VIVRSALGWVFVGAVAPLVVRGMLRKRISICLTEMVKPSNA
jgi:hypothetical protein